MQDPADHRHKCNPGKISRLWITSASTIDAEEPRDQHGAKMADIATNDSQAQIRQTQNPAASSITLTLTRFSNTD